jgi:hypothetical protein
VVKRPRLNLEIVAGYEAVSRLRILSPAVVEGEVAAARVAGVTRGDDHLGAFREPRRQRWIERWAVVHDVKRNADSRTAED